MAVTRWPLKQDRPVVEVVLTFPASGVRVSRVMLADTGAGSAQAPFELILDESDCLSGAGKPSRMVYLGGAYSGAFPLYLVRVDIPSLSFRMSVPAVGVPTPPMGVDGIACFRFLNRFTYGNFGNAGEFGLEC